MRTTLALTLFLIVAGAITIGTLQSRQTRIDLASEHATLEARVAALAGEPERHRRFATNTPSQNELAEARDAKRTLAAWQAAPESVAPAATPVESGKATFAPRIVSAQNLMPPAQWRPAGTTTPQAALETYCWAIKNQNADALAECIVLEKSVAEKVTRNLEERPPGSPPLTPELLVARSLALRNKSLCGLGIGDVRTVDEHRVALRARLDHGEGRVREYEFVFERRPEGWRQVVSDPDNVLNFKFPKARS